MSGYDRWKTRSPDDDLKSSDEPTPEQQRADWEDEQQHMMGGPDYAEILRLYRKFSPRKGAALWEVFICICQELEGSARKERCPACGHTGLVYGRLVDPWCRNPWHSGVSSADRWEVGKNGWDTSDEITREDI